MDKKKLSVKSINEILDKLEDSKKLLYDGQYIERLYVEYQKHECDDEKDRVHLRNWLGGRRSYCLHRVRMLWSRAVKLWTICPRKAQKMW